jgi:hypothetical protein
LLPALAITVGIEAQKDGVAPNVSEEELRQRVLKTQWTPVYPIFAKSQEKHP